MSADWCSRQLLAVPQQGTAAVAIKNSAPAQNAATLPYSSRRGEQHISPPQQRRHMPGVGHEASAVALLAGPGAGATTGSKKARRQSTSATCSDYRHVSSAATAAPSRTSGS